jgi:hypothetical protein
MFAGEVVFEDWDESVGRVLWSLLVIEEDVRGTLEIEGNVG